MFESPSHWMVVAAVVLVLFGYKKLPEMSRSVGRSLRIFKTEMKGLTEDDAVREAASSPTASPAVETAAKVESLPAASSQASAPPAAEGAVNSSANGSQPQQSS